MLGIGLQLALNWRGLRKIEALGGRLWKLISPLAHKLLPPRNPAQALGLGLVWGWLPCGLVYTMLAAAAVAGSGLHGAALMGAFGLGTLPAMFGATAAAHKLTAWSRKPALRQDRRRHHLPVRHVDVGIAGEDGSHAAPAWRHGHQRNVGIWITVRFFSIPGAVPAPTRH